VNLCGYVHVGASSVSVEGWVYVKKVSVQVTICGLRVIVRAYGSHGGVWKRASLGYLFLFLLFSLTTSFAIGPL